MTLAEGSIDNYKAASCASRRGCCLRDLPPAGIGRVVTFGELAGAPAAFAT
jgi:hypothetical protein